MSRPLSRGPQLDDDAEAGVAADLPDGVEAQRRGGILFLLNHADRAAEVSGVVGTDLLTGQACTGHV
ncbi:Beta-galactosidase C-terminal domain [Actinomyces oris]|uniref:Beta-galactosidase C-terminal domain-containing protein n=1 Tax=Actinomyces oris TaxID=544580 RepID=A0A1Q8HYZ3_9ACTO|nr:Beta-galactosidase C-terminal domain [Actinomyces oris]OLL14079.1 hypothetical protein BKH32_10460 [Actinomyces oris]